MASSYNLDIPLFRYNAVIIFGETGKECEDERMRIWATENPDDPLRDKWEDYDFWGSYRIIEAEEGHSRNMPALLFVTKGHKEYTKKRWNDEMHITMAHECLHAAYDCIDIVGIDIDVDNHEALAYVHSFMYKRCIEIWNELNKRKR